MATPTQLSDTETLEIVVPLGEPRTPDPERRHKVVQDNISTWRRVFQDGVSHQICLARDPDYSYPHQQFVDDDGETSREIAYLKPEPWWYDEDGVTYLRLNFGERTFTHPRKNPVVRVGTPDDLLATLEQIYLMVEAGELDAMIEKMVIVSER